MSLGSARSSPASWRQPACGGGYSRSSCLLSATTMRALAAVGVGHTELLHGRHELRASILGDTNRRVAHDLVEAVADDHAVLLDGLLRLNGGVPGLKPLVQDGQLGWREVVLANDLVAEFLGFGGQGHLTQSSLRRLRCSSCASGRRWSRHRSIAPASGP